jgi:hypothetical protein
MPRRTMAEILANCNPALLAEYDHADMYYNGNKVIFLGIDRDDSEGNGPGIWLTLIQHPNFPTWRAQFIELIHLGIDSGKIYPPVIITREGGLITSTDDVPDLINALKNVVPISIRDKFRIGGARVTAFGRTFIYIKRKVGG